MQCQISAMQAGESLAKAKKKLEIYAKTSKEYQEHKDSYEKMRQMFLNEQAGMLAADLKPGISLSGLWFDRSSTSVRRSGGSCGYLT